jgi:hypothetical protein
MEEEVPSSRDAIFRSDLGNSPLRCDFKGMKRCCDTMCQIYGLFEGRCRLGIGKRGREYPANRRCGKANRIGAQNKNTLHRATATARLKGQVFSYEMKTRLFSCSWVGRSRRGHVPQHSRMPHLQRPCNRKPRIQAQVSSLLAPLV